LEYFLQKHTDYSQLPMLTTSLDEIRKLCSQTVEPASIRPLYSDNFITKTEEYVFETERRKHSHKTGKVYSSPFHFVALYLILFDRVLRLTQN